MSTGITTPKKRGSAGRKNYEESRERDRKIVEEIKAVIAPPVAPDFISNFLPKINADGRPVFNSTVRLGSIPVALPHSSGANISHRGRISDSMHQAINSNAD